MGQSPTPGNRRQKGDDVGQSPTSANKEAPLQTSSDGRRRRGPLSKVSEQCNNVVTIHAYGEGRTIRNVKQDVVLHFEFTGDERFQGWRHMCSVGTLHNSPTTPFNDAHPSTRHPSPTVTKACINANFVYQCANEASSAVVDILKSSNHGGDGSPSPQKKMPRIMGGEQGDAMLEVTHDFLVGDVSRS